MRTQCEVQRERQGPDEQVRELRIQVSAQTATQVQVLRLKQLEGQTAVQLPPRGMRTRFFEQEHRRHRR